jgi:cyanophycin synthetase
MKNPLHPPPFFAPDAGLAPDVAALVAAARRRGIPCIRHPEGAGLVQLGWGRRARRIQGAVTWNTSHIAVQIARDATLAKSLLHDAGVPVPPGAEARGPREAVEIFHRLGAPVVVRALGAGVAEEAAGLASDDAVRAAYERARRRASAVVVERELPGADHRALVVDGRLVAVARLAPPSVVGDGFRTVAGLVDAENRARRDAGGTSIPADEAAQEMLARQGLALESIPPAGMRVKLRAAADLAAGAIAEDVTATVHPAVAGACERAARAIGLEVAGVLLACEQVSTPLEAQGGGVVGITAAPDICMHGRAGSPGVADSVLRTLFGEGGDGRIPLVVVAGGGAGGIARLVAQGLQSAGVRTGLASGEGIRIGDSLLKAGDGTGPESAFAVLGSPEAEAAVLQLSPAALVMPLPFDRCDVAVLTAPGACVMPGAMELAASARSVVLEAAEPGSRALARTLPRGASIVYVSAEGPGDSTANGRVPGAASVYLRGDTVLLATAERRIPLTQMRRLPSGFSIDDALAAIAALWSCGLDEGAIAAALAAPAAQDRDFHAASFDRVRARAVHAHR